MHKFAKTAILATAVIASLATTFEAASAGDRWRRGFHNHGWRYHHGPGFRGRWAAAGVLGLTAGVIVGEALSQPRVVYRERPDVVVHEGPYADPDAADEYVGPVDGDDPDDDVYVAPRDHSRVYQSQRDDRYQGDDEGRMDEQAQDDNYFPDRPAKEHKRPTKNTVTAEVKLEPWTAKWRTYCKQRFPSFNATTGTYKGYDGKSHFCTSG